METLLPLSAEAVPARPGSGGAETDVWTALERLGSAATVVLDIARGPGSGHDPGWAAATERLTAAGVRLLGYVDLAFGSRLVGEVRAETARWTGYPVEGIFFDQVPTSPYLVAPVAVAAGTARRAGLPRVVLNPGQPPDGLYRELGAQVCVFDGPWSRLRTWPGEGAQAGDGYLVHGVPPDERADAEADLAARGAGFALVTDRVPPRPYTAPPSWLDLTSVAG